jgi:hypothetical protein
LRQAKKILHKPVTFFSAEKPAAKSPRPPRNSPQTHQQNTTICIRFFQKPLQKPHSTTPEKNPATKSTAPRFVGV